MARFEYLYRSTAVLPNCTRKEARRKIENIYPGCTVRDLHESGFVLGSIPAEAILGSRRVWKAILNLGEELAARGRMTGEEIVKALRNKKLTAH